MLMKILVMPVGVVSLLTSAFAIMQGPFFLRLSGRFFRLLLLFPS